MWTSSREIENAKVFSFERIWNELKSGETCKEIKESKSVKASEIAATTTSHELHAHAANEANESASENENPSDEDAFKYVWWF